MRFSEGKMPYNFAVERSDTALSRGPAAHRRSRYPQKCPNSGIRKKVMSEPILIAVITSAGVVLAAWIARVTLTKGHLGWMAMGIILGAGCIYGFAEFRQDKLIEGRDVPQASNVALKKQVSASQSHKDAPPAHSIDDDPNTAWNSGASAAANLPQWIEVDLGKPYNIEAIELIVSQNPPGPTLHKVSGSADGKAGWMEICSLEGDTSDRQVLRNDHQQEPWPNIRFIKVQTERSQGWVSWREIRVFAREKTTKESG